MAKVQAIKRRIKSLRADTVPDNEPFHGVELNVTPKGVSVIPVDFPNMQLDVQAEHVGVMPRAVLALNKHILLRMLMQGYNKFNAHSDGMMPVVGGGGRGCYITMPLRTIPKKAENSIQTTKEEKKMEVNHNVVSAPERTVVPNPGNETNPLDELGNNIENLRLQLKAMLDESVVLARKVKEAVLAQKQREREFVQNKRTLERIRMAI